MRDLQVYYDAAGMLLKGESPYGQAFGLSSGFYKYSASAAVLFMPFHAIGWLATRIVFFVIISGSVAWFLPDLTNRFLRALQFDGTKWKSVVLFTALALGGHISRELLLGNVNWLLFLLVFSGFFLLRKSAGMAGLLLALALVFKPHFAVIVPWLVLRKEWKALLSLGAGIVVFLFLPSLGWGVDRNSALFTEWMQAMQAHNTSLAESPNTFYGMFYKLTGVNASWVVLLFLAVAAGAIFFWMLRHFKAEAHLRAATTPVHPALLRRNRLLEYATLLALVPNLVHTDTEHFMWTFPLLVTLAGAWFRLTGEKVLIAVLTLIALIPYTLNTPDLWGQQAAEFFDKGGVLGLSNVLLIALALYSHHRVMQERKELIGENTGV